jgi:PKHD-type hydroxylase
MIIRPIFIPNENIDQTEYFWYENAFNEEELEWINNLKDLYEFEKASIVGTTSYEIDDVRNSKIKWIHHDENSEWLFNKLSDLSINANNQLWGFDIYSIIDSIQYTEYPEGGGHYDWHVDIGPGSINHRKISMVTQLSGPEEYNGGDLEIWSGGEFRKVPKIKGSTVIFPSFLMHRVTPVTKGLRKSLVLWIGGSTYK